MSISMVVQNFSPILCFLQNKWAQNMAAEETAEGKKKKKVGKPIGDPVGTGCPNDVAKHFTGCVMLVESHLRTCIVR